MVMQMEGVHVGPRAKIFLIRLQYSWTFLREIRRSEFLYATRVCDSCAHVRGSYENMFENFVRAYGPGSDRRLI